MTILFADLRGYTALAETLPPERLVDVLNGHLTVAAQAILAQEGTISTFVGDLVMAIYNAPLPQPDHALRAARTALALHQDMARYHAESAARAAHELWHWDRHRRGGGGQPWRAGATALYG